MIRYEVNLSMADAAGKLSNIILRSLKNSETLELIFTSFNSLDALPIGIASVIQTCSYITTNIPQIGEVKGVNIKNVKFISDNKDFDLNLLQPIMRSLSYHAKSLNEIIIENKSPGGLEFKGESGAFLKLLSDATNITKLHINSSSESESSDLPVDCALTSEGDFQVNFLLMSMYNHPHLTEIIVSTVSDFMLRNLQDLVNSCRSLKLLSLPGARINAKDLIPLGLSISSQQKLELLHLKDVLIEEDLFQYALAIDPSMSKYKSLTDNVKINNATETVRQKFYEILTTCNLYKLIGLDTVSDYKIDIPIFYADNMDLKAILEENYSRLDARNKDLVQNEKFTRDSDIPGVTLLKKIGYLFYSPRSTDEDKVPAATSNIFGEALGAASGESLPAKTETREDGASLGESLDMTPSYLAEQQNAVESLGSTESAELSGKY